MDDKRDNRTPAAETDASAYRDALYSRAPEAGKSCYGYSPAQCYARASAAQDPPVKRKTGLAVLIASAAFLVICILAAGLLSTGSLVLSSRASAAGEDQEPPSRELYEDFQNALDGEEDALSLTRAAQDEPEELSAEEIYSVACASTVGVTVPGYATNIFGQSGAFTVTGTGIILSEDGYVLTNYHVIEDAYLQGAPILVITYDEAEREAEVVGVETDSDLAVLKIPAEGLVPAQVGDSDSLRVGQTIYTVGNPLGELTYTMTSGIVSALNRLVTTDVNVTVNMFQIDAAVNNGNSGGPVFNVYGQVIGVVTAKYSQFGMEGLGFAIPIGDACQIACDLVEKGYVSGKAYLGLNAATVSPSAARYYGMVQGVYIYSVVEGSCAEAAGLQAGDIITAIDGAEVTTSTELAKAVKRYRAGDRAELTVYRESELMTVTVVFDEELPAERTDSRGPRASAELILREG